MHLAWIRSHVQICLQDIWSKCRIEADVDGDFPYRFDTAACFVRVEAGPPAMIRIFATAAEGVPRTSKLLQEINDVNAASLTAHVYWDNGAVLVEHTVLATTADRAALAHACESVGTVARDIGALVAAVFGGSTPYPACLTAAEGESE